MFPSSGNDLELTLNPESFIANLAKANKAREAFEKGVEGAGAKMSAAYDNLAKAMISQSSRVEQSQNRLVKSLEAQAAAAGKTGVERLIAQRNNLLSQYPKIADADERQIQRINRIREAYDKLIAVEKQRDGGGGSGFNVNFAIRGVKDLMEGRLPNAAAEGENLLSSLKGLPLILGGVTAGIAAAGLAVYEFHKHLVEVEQAPERIRNEFSRLTDGTRLSNAELLVQNDRLEQSIAKLEHRPEDGIKLSIDEAAKSALTLSGNLDKALHNFLELSSKNAPGFFARFVEGHAGFDDVKKLVGGDTGFGGMIGDVYSSSDPAAALGKYRTQVAAMLDSATATQKPQLGPVTGFDRFGEPIRSERTSTYVDPRQNERIEVLRALENQIDADLKSYSLEKDHDALQKKETALQAAAEANNALTSRRSDRQSQLSTAQGEIYSTGSPLDKAYSEFNKHEADGVRMLAEDAKYRDAALTSLDQQIIRQTKLNDLTKIALEWKKNAEDIDKVLGEAPLLKSSNKLVSMMNPGTEVDPKQYVDEASKFMADNRAIFGSVSSAAPGGYISPQEQLRQAGDNERHGLALAGTQLKMSGLGDSEQADAMKSIREQYADQEYSAMKRIADVKADGAEHDLAIQDAKDRQAQKYADAETERQETLAQLQLKQFDEIKNKAESLFNTLFTHPSQFGKQLSSTIRESALRPLTEGLADHTARILQPIFGDGHGSGGAGLNSVKLVSGAVPVVVVGGHDGGSAAPWSGGSSGGGSFMSSGGGFSGGQLPSLPGFDRQSSIIQMLGSAGSGGIDLSAIADLPSIDRMSGMIGASGPGDYAGSPAGNGRGRAALSPLSGMKGAFGGLMAGGLSWNPKGTVGWNSEGKPTDEYGNVLSGGLKASLGGISRDSSGHLQTTGALKGGLMAGGMMLAQQGLIGSSRGTGAGIAEGAAGGAMIGTAIMPGIGTAVGAAVGAGIGLGEMLAGVESPENQAKRLAKQLYRISINTAEAKQIVSLAQSKYGNNISVAMHSPEVRQMLGLYSAGTGQAGKFPMGADTPHGASLVEQAGVLSQQARWQYGNAYTYASSLPVLGGSQSYPLQTASISLSVSGTDTANFFTGQVVTPSFVSSQNSAALNGSMGRTQTALDLSEPGSIVG